MPVMDEEIPMEALLSNHEEYIGQYERKYKKYIKSRKENTPPQLYHLYALQHLCQYANLFGLESSWIYDAFIEQLRPKNITVLENYYLGGFVDALIECGCKKLPAFSETAYWIGWSETKVVSSYKAFVDLHSGYSPSDYAVIFRWQKIKIASAFINSVGAPFPEGKGKKEAEIVFNNLQKQIKELGFENEPAPFSWKIKKKKKEVLKKNLRTS